MAAPNQEARTWLVSLDERGPQPETDKQARLTSFIKELERRRGAVEALFAGIADVFA
jgi:hypothetical protein